MKNMNRDKETRFIFDKFGFTKLLDYFKSKYKSYTMSKHENYYFPNFRLRKGNYSNKPGTQYYLINNSESSKIVKKKENLTKEQFDKLLKKHESELILITKSTFYEFNNYKLMLEMVTAIKDNKQLKIFTTEVEDYSEYENLINTIEKLNIKYTATQDSLKTIALKEFRKVK